MLRRSLLSAIPAALLTPLVERPKLRDCACGQRHVRKDPVLILHSRTRWTSFGLSKEEFREVGKHLRMLRSDPNYKVFFAFPVIDIEEAFRGRISSGDLNKLV